jgi:hypothetical protein
MREDSDVALSSYLSIGLLRFHQIYRDGKEESQRLIRYPVG